MSGLVGAEQFAVYAKESLSELGFKIYGAIPPTVLDGATAGNTSLTYIHQTGLFLSPFFQFYDGKIAGLTFGRCWTLEGYKHRIFSHRYGAFTEYFGLKDTNRFYFVPDSHPEHVYADICESVAETLPVILQQLTYEVLEEIEGLPGGARDQKRRYFGDRADEAVPTACELKEK